MKHVVLRGVHAGDDAAVGQHLAALEADGNDGGALRNIFQHGGKRLRAVRLRRREIGGVELAVLRVRAAGIVSSGEGLVFLVRFAGLLVPRLEEIAEVPVGG